MRKRMIVDPLRSKSWEKLNSGRKRNNRLNFVPNFDVKSVGNGSKLAFSAENWTLEYPSAFKNVFLILKDRSKNSREEEGGGRRQSTSAVDCGLIILV